MGKGVGDMNYLDWIRSRICAVCECSSDTEPHHIKGEYHLSGVGMKANDIFTIPVCRKCHEFLHSGAFGWKEEQRRALTETLVAAIKAEKIGFIK